MTPENSNHDELAAIKNQLFILLLALIVVSGTVTVYLYRQTSLARTDIDQAERMSATISTNEVVIGRLVQNLVAFGEKHPDFMPVLKKNGIYPQPAAPAAAPRK